mmetsp:Transcript_26777/g.86737  ORF Transcript_26777/g.86737 Transcript_26777/m.86737 type:complete len:107 (+) Transcript_26777:349-669(+)
MPELSRQSCAFEIASNVATHKKPCSRTCWLSRFVSRVHSWISVAPHVGKRPSRETLDVGQKDSEALLVHMQSWQLQVLCRCTPSLCDVVVQAVCEVVTGFGRHWCH